MGPSLRGAVAALACLLIACASEPPGAARGDSLLVVLDADAALASAAGARALRAAGAERDHLVAAARRRALDRLPGSVEVLQQFRHLPLLRVRARDAGAVRALLSQPGVLRVQADKQYALLLSRALPFVRQPAAAAQGQLGAGTTIAVIDGPVDEADPAFGRCAAPGAIGGAGCKLAAAVRFAKGDGLQLPRAHATNVAAIALGVAPAARVAALDVLSGPTAYAGEILAAIDWAIDQQGPLGIAALNLSLGAGAHDAPCADDAIAVALAWARTAGILSAVAAGNDGHAAALAEPACAPAALSVGAVYDADLGPVAYAGCTDGASGPDRVPCFSNGAQFLSLLAPGAVVTAGGSTMAGTSQAAPFVAGAVAVLRAAFPAESVAALAARLSRSGAPVADPRTHLSTPRIDVAAALKGPPSSSPLATLLIDGGAALTRDTRVSLSLRALPGAHPAALCLSNEEYCLRWQPFAASLDWTLEGGRGARTVRAWLRDASGAETDAPAVASIDLEP